MKLWLSRNEVIRDLPIAYREQNDINSMSGVELASAWKRFGIHAGTWDWDDVGIRER